MPPLLRQGDLFAGLEAVEAVPPPRDRHTPMPRTEWECDDLARAGVVCLTCGADVAAGERHSAACEALHGPTCPPWDGQD